MSERGSKKIGAKGAHHRKRHNSSVSTVDIFFASAATNKPLTYFDQIETTKNNKVRAPAWLKIKLSSSIDFPAKNIHLMTQFNFKF